MKYKLLITTLVASFALVACNDSSTSKPAATKVSEASVTEVPTTDASKVELPQACEDFFRKVNDFVAQFPGMDATMKQSFESIRDDAHKQIATLPATAQASTCEQAVATFEQSVAAIKK